MRRLRHCALANSSVACVKAKPTTMMPYRMSQVLAITRTPRVVAVAIFEAAQRHRLVADVWTDVFHCAVSAIIERDGTAAARLFTLVVFCLSSGIRAPRYENRRMTRSALARRDRSNAANIWLKRIASDCFPDSDARTATDGFDTWSLRDWLPDRGSRQPVQPGENLEGVVRAACDARHRGRTFLKA